MMQQVDVDLVSSETEGNQGNVPGEPEEENDEEDTQIHNGGEEDIDSYTSIDQEDYLTTAPRQHSGSGDGCCRYDSYDSNADSESGDEVQVLVDDRKQAGFARIKIEGEGARKDRPTTGGKEPRLAFADFSPEEQTEQLRASRPSIGVKVPRMIYHERKGPPSEKKETKTVAKKGSGTMEKPNKTIVPEMQTGKGAGARLDTQGKGIAGRACQSRTGHGTAMKLGKREKVSSVVST
jgi:hypothetical protein